VKVTSSPGPYGLLERALNRTREEILGRSGSGGWRSVLLRTAMRSVLVGLLLSLAVVSVRPNMVGFEKVMYNKISPVECLQCVTYFKPVH